jgi:hypothetical protein
MKNKKCKCGEPAMHHYHAWWETQKDVYQCCECHIIDGGVPSDWHEGCMNATKKLSDNSGLCDMH